MSHREKIKEVLDDFSVIPSEVRKVLANRILAITGEGKESTLGACRPSLIPLDEGSLRAFFIERSMSYVEAERLSHAICQKFGRPELDEDEVREHIIGQIYSFVPVDFNFISEENFGKISTRIAHALISEYKKGGITK